MKAKPRIWYRSVGVGQMLDSYNISNRIHAFILGRSGLINPASNPLKLPNFTILSRIGESRSLFLLAIQTESSRLSIYKQSSISRDFEGPAATSQPLQRLGSRGKPAPGARPDGQQPPSTEVS
jgi:hypothetical protein